MSFDQQRLYELLPAIYRIRDADQGEPLKALLEVIADQVGTLEENLAQLYDDQFIETCANWVVPYIGDLIGYRALHTNMPNGGIPRAEVAHTIAFRRRKGTATMLEQMARDVTGWDARVVEFFQILGWTQYMNHLRPQSRYAPDLRQWEPLERLNTAFDTISHTVDVRQVERGGRYNIPDIGLFFWRLKAYSLTHSPAVAVAAGDSQRFLFNPLGLSRQLFTRPEPEATIDHLAEPVNVPDPISRRILDSYLPAYYGTGKSIHIEGFDNIDRINVCNLSDIGGGNWAHSPAAGRVAIDPLLGRIAFGDPQVQPPLVTFHSGFSADMGGGEYERSTTIDPLLQPVVTIPKPNSAIQSALNLVKNGGAAEISNSGRYVQKLLINVNAERRLELRAADRHRPTIILSAPLEISGGTNSTVILNGLMITGGQLRISAGASNHLKRLILKHCTLVPGSEPSLIVDLPDVAVELDHCITGALRITSLATVKINDSIIDATSDTAVAFSALDNFGPGGVFQIIDSTIVGKVHTREMQLASNTIFYAGLAPDDPWIKPVGTPVSSERKQNGCVRFCCLPWDSLVPPRHRCLPASEGAIFGMRPQFTSLRYGDPGYGQLSLAAAQEIRNGADDEGEMGAFHKLYQPQREANVRIRLQEYIRVGLDAGLYYVT